MTAGAYIEALRLQKKATEKYGLGKSIISGYCNVVELCGSIWISGMILLEQVSYVIPF